jgi:hypothetical protein
VGQKGDCAGRAGAVRLRQPSPAAPTPPAGTGILAISQSRERPAPHRRGAGREIQLAAWRWARDSRTDDGSLPSGKDIARQYGRHERWGRLVKRSGLAGVLGT